MITKGFFDDPEMANLEASLYSINDGETETRENILMYIDAVNFTDGTKYFYNMMPFVRFLNVKDCVAYTTPYCEIFLNAPTVVETEDLDENPLTIDLRSKQHWDFIYCHECLHQMWNTFEVGDKLQKKGYKFSHKLLNVASDCVINDFLAAVLKKTPPGFGVTPEFIEKRFGVKYDRYKDTQYSLYLKLLAHETDVLEDEFIKNMLEQDEQNERNGEQGANDAREQLGGQDGQNGQGGQNGQNGQGSQQETHSKEYTEGWNRCIREYKEGRLTKEEVKELVEKLQNK